MIIDILSDIHLDTYFKGEISEAAIASVYTHIFTDNHKRNVGDALVIAGDIGHNNKQNMQALELFQEVFGYKYIICVLGNHDYYLANIHEISDHNGFSLNRVKEMRQLINEKKGMYCLDGNIVEIDGVRFGGCDSWYDGEYIRKHFNKKTKEYMDSYVSMLWQKSMPDSNYVFGIDWQRYAKAEKQKIEKIYKDIDVMITHVNPSIEKKYISHSFKDEDTTGYFTFDGERYLKEGSMKYWIYGHTHIETEHKIGNVKCICNPMGYPGANGNGEWTWIKSIEL